MGRLYSQRKRPAPAELDYTVPDEVRRRILHAIEQLAENHGTFDFPELLGQIGKKLLVTYGGLCRPGYEAARTSDDPVIEHFFSCDDEMALDFLEACFEPFHNPRQAGVDAINEIFQDGGVGYELTPYIETVTGKPPGIFGKIAGGTVEIQRPQIIERSSQFVHAEVVTPALRVLLDVKYKGANDEFLSAHEHYRHGRYKECLNECLKAFESTMKIICHDKKWAHAPTVTAQALIKVCLDNALIPTFSEQQLTSLRTLLESGVPTARNKTSGHGQGVQVVEVPAHLARYGLHLTAASILLLTEAAEGKL